MATLRQHMKRDDIARNNVEYDDIFGCVSKQKEVTVLFAKLLEIRKRLIDEQAEPVL